MSGYNEKGFQSIPHNSIITFLSTEEVLENASLALKAAGIKEEQIHCAYGEEGLRRIDPDGSHHGLWARIVRTVQRLAGAEARLIEQVEDALKHGDYILRVETDGSEVMKDSILKTIESYTEKSIFYVGSGTISALKAGKNYYLNLPASATEDEATNPSNGVQ
ncbi:MAG: hypothetical protein AAF614_40825 [Chloroflexota bacterium]